MHSRIVLKHSKIDKGMFGLIMALVGFGLIMVFSSSFYLTVKGGEIGDQLFFLREQLIRIGFAIIAFLIGFKINYKLYRKLLPVLLFVGIVVLIVTIFTGRKAYGATRWLRIATFSLQPSEFIKLVVFIYLASFYGAREPQAQTFKKFVLPPSFIVGLILLLIVLEPDLGTAVIIAITAVFVMFISGVKLRYLIGILIVGFVLFIVAVLVLPHAKARISSFISNGNYQVRQSRIAIGSGGFSGVGLGEGKQKFLFLPQPHTDFIFSVIGEELGWLGIVVLTGVFFFYLIKGLELSWKSKDRYAQILGAAIAVSTFLHFFVHSGVAMGILPTTGLTLPFISYGGSSLLANMFAAGVLLNIGSERRIA